MTTLAPSIYPSAYRVIGDLLLTNEAYTFQGATFYVDGQASKTPQRQVTGCTITLGLVAADSVVLRTLAWSGTSVAASATRWLRYFYPRILVPTPVPVATTTTPRLAVAPKTVLAESGVLLGAAYPNPAQTEVNITCQLAQADQTAELRFINLLTGRVGLVVPVEGMGTERRQRVALTGLPAGQYAYQLVVEGQMAAAPQKLIIIP